jgi:hypothetical protein
MRKLAGKADILPFDFFSFFSRSLGVVERKRKRSGAWTSISFAEAAVSVRIHDRKNFQVE